MPESQLIMKFPLPQLQATFLERPQRFLVEMLLPDGSEVTAYCANSGSFKGCLESGVQALLWDSENPKRKRRYTWRAIKLNGVWVGTDTHLSNGIVENILNKKLRSKIYVTMIHGSKDEAVPTIYSRKVLKLFDKAKKKLIIIKNGDHSLSNKKNLKKITLELNKIVSNVV